MNWKHSTVSATPASQPNHAVRSAAVVRRIQTLAPSPLAITGITAPPGG
jgi:hypothetical protein